MAEATDEVPAMFYKYRSMSGEAAKWVERAVLHNEVYFPSTASFNDPFDLRPTFSLQTSAGRQREDFLRMSKRFEPNLTEEQHLAETERVMAASMSAENIAHTTDTLQALHTQFITTAVGVFCVSTKRDDILMWSHYADSHKGICLEFDGGVAFLDDAQKVQYSRERAPINPYKDSQAVMMEKVLLTKSNHWSYEAEWWLCRYIGGPGVGQFSPQNLTGIIIGALASRSTVATIGDWAGRRSIPIKLYRTSVSNKNFELEIRPS